MDKKQKNFVFVSIFLVSMSCTILMVIFIVQSMSKNQIIEIGVKEFNEEIELAEKEYERQEMEIKNFDKRIYNEKFGKKFRNLKVSGEIEFNIDESELKKKDMRNTREPEKEKKYNFEDKYEKLSNKEKWWLYFFGPK